VKDSELRSLFGSCSQQRSKVASELQNEAVRLGESKPEDSSSVGGSLHRARTTLEGTVSAQDAHAILAKCERGEDSAVKKYKKTMEENLASPVREIISRQYDEVKSAHDRICTLRDSRAAAKN
jgi:uncharacterized protein (TIGR02284 family)